MHSPYTNDFLGAFTAAQAGAAGVLSAAVAARVRRFKLAGAPLVAAAGLLVLAPLVAAHRAPFEHTPAWLDLPLMLAAARVLVTASALASRRAAPALVSLAAELALYELTALLTESDLELVALHMASAGLVAGLILRREAPAGFAPSPVPFWNDPLLFAASTAAGAAVCHFVLGRYTNSGDEWANTFQASVFAKARAYADEPPCAEAFQAYWVFDWRGRLFAQYTPGWPLFMAPFQRLGAAWLAGPFSFGLLVVGLARITRRVMRLSSREGDARAAGNFAALAAMLGSTFLINGASRYPHVFVAALYAWSLEALFAVLARELDLARRVGWGLVLGLASSLMVAARPVDGLVLGVGLFAGFVHGALEGRFARDAFAATIGSFAAVALLSIVVLRLQTGEWLTTGYSLTRFIHPWVPIGAFSVPRPSELKWGFPVATGTYCWWPCSIPGGVAGLALLRGRAWRVGGVLLASYAPLVVLYTLSELGRGFELGYGPRYQLTWVVPMAIGTGALLGAVWGWSRQKCRTSRRRFGLLSLGLALGSVLGGAALIAPLVYPFTHDDVWVHNRMRIALDASGLRNAVVFAGAGLNNTDPMDLTENYPLDLYPGPNVVIALDRSPELVSCVRERFAGRSFYRAVPGEPVTFVPF